LKSTSAVVALIILVALLWTYRDRLGLQERARAAMPELDLPAMLRSPWKSAPAAGPASGVRKCVNGTQSTYTNADCPAGSRQVELTGGSVSVLPVPPAVEKGTGDRGQPVPGSVGGPGDPLGPAAKEAQIDRLIDTGRSR
jgi:hypothetical protein